MVKLRNQPGGASLIAAGLEAVGYGSKIGGFLRRFSRSIETCDFEPFAHIQPTIMIQKIRFAADNPLFPVLASFWQWRKLWIGCAVAFSTVGLVYAVVFKSDTWVATQGLIVRDEATGTVMRLGRFESQSQMKAAQELVLEIASSPPVVSRALNAVGRQPKFFGLIKGSSTFSPAEVESFGRNCVSVRAPRGAELGTTEVIYLEVKQNSKERAVQLAAAICTALEGQLQEVRRDRADGVLQELQAAIAVSESELARSTEKLKNIELEAGADLVDLRGLTDSNSGSTNRLMLDLVRDDLRKCEIELQLHRENLEAMQIGLNKPELLMQVTDRLVDSQPTIKRLREGLSEARLRTAQLQGRYSDSHADVIIAKVTEQRFRDNLLRELANSEQAILGAIELCEKKIDKLNDQERELGKRLNRLADIRADYTNVVSEVKATNEELQQIRRELTQAMAARNAASSSSLITRIDQPQLGDRPVGPGRTTIVGGSLVGGLFLGLGIVFLLTPLGGIGPTDRRPSPSQGWSGSSSPVSNGKQQPVEESLQHFQTIIQADSASLGSSLASELNDVEASLCPDLIQVSGNAHGAKACQVHKNDFDPTVDGCSPSIVHGESPELTAKSNDLDAIQAMIAKTFGDTLKVV